MLDIDPQQVQIKPDVVRLPGCFTVEIKNVRVLDNRDAIGNSFFAKAEYQWWNVREFGQLKCQNASANGCGGYGNNWYGKITELEQFDCFSATFAMFARVSPSWTRAESVHRSPINFEGSVARRDLGSTRSERSSVSTTGRPLTATAIADLTSFKEIDSKTIDPLSPHSNRLDMYGDTQSGSGDGAVQGTVVAKIRLAFNATGTIAEKRANKEAQIEESVQRELDERRRNWDVNNGQFDKFRQWYIDYRKNLWHK